MKMAILNILSILMLGCFLTACAQNNSTLVNTWKDPEYTTQKCAKVLVVGINENLGRRMSFEDEFTHVLKSGGIDALQSYLVIKWGPGLTLANVVAAVKSAGADCVITTRLVNLQEEKRLVPGYEAFMIAYPEMDITPGGPSVASIEITVTKATVETRLFDAGTAKMVWATGGVGYDFYNLVKPEPLIKDYARNIFKVLKKEGLF